MTMLALQRYGFMALLAAALFGASTPAAKHLLGDVGPLTLAGLLYLGAGVGLLVFKALRGRRAEAPLRRRDMPWLAGAIAAGGVAGPVLLLWGLAQTPASTASLLLSFEGVITVFIAAIAFGEAVARRVWLGAFVMLAGGLVLSYDPAAAFGVSIHAVAIIAACALWGVDNNLTRKISAADPAMITLIKGLVAGAINLLLGWLAAEPFPSVVTVFGAMALGALSYGASLVLYVRALRHLGAARAAAHFGTAPFFGAILAIVILGEPATGAFALSGALIAIATWLVLSERHQHAHAHEPLRHEHVHTHDEHHRHTHTGAEGPEPHAHEHVHEPLEHSHPHLPDIHHRHPH
jgi:drug/metabolite transporter (DMT)-like permease